MAAGKKTGGRQRGVPNKATAKRQEEVEASGLTPLDYMLSLLRDEALGQDVRFEAAKSAAPYVHPRLAATQVTGELALIDVLDEPMPSEDEWSRDHGHA
jgi:hypothetical protein